MTQSGGGCRKHFFSVTPYNFQKSAGGGVEAPPSPSLSAGPVKDNQGLAKWHNLSNIATCLSQHLL